MIERECENCDRNGAGWSKCSWEPGSPSCLRAFLPSRAALEAEAARRAERLRHELDPNDDDFNPLEVFALWGRESRARAKQIAEEEKRKQEIKANARPFRMIRESYVFTAAEIEAAIRNPPFLMPDDRLRAAALIAAIEYDLRKREGGGAS